LPGHLRLASLPRADSLCLVWLDPGIIAQQNEELEKLTKERDALLNR
jgi:hypothetical protein